LYWGKSLLQPGGWFISYDVEPFLPSGFHLSFTISAYLHLRDGAPLPPNIWSVWFGGSSGGIIQQVARESADHLRQLAISGGQFVTDEASSGSYAMFNNPLGNIYWESALRLSEGRQSYCKPD